MTEKKPVPGLRSLLEDTFGLKIDDEMRKRIESRFGTTLDDDPSRWTDVKRSLAVSTGEDPDADDRVRAVIERLAAEIHDEAAPPAAWTDRLAAALDDGLDDDAREDLAEDWFAEVGSNAERSAWIADHPENFRA